ncbi:single-stranded-DNA-specific exonuclease RecJ [Candidatus Epulonipiscium fishelsonii]|uniref:Single-stranded-DNA-specific exonuclease RecJ n=1 Tax=Candidatus Epulonipiscium fishelsonii TaxID=77094 RepID=A0ACC8XGN2_9FIRM|nr:single-stranded-DNA-specific exonuclease RecJ [Epulopiscium sp. SCG-B05WGA-EpuloA1]ONI42649.1 single-stranded-DNA-specific exonuclease RecJ [Epulopiscium sp. SCG-B11WGA-EpuloA1]
MLPNNFKWNVQQLDNGQDIIEQILQNRHIENKENFLNPTIEQIIDPYLLNDMEKCVNRIQASKTNNENIVIYGDYDVDGMTSTAILYMFLKSQGYSVEYYIPDRQTEGYGLNKNALKQISEKVNLVITVDTGIAATEEVAYANSLGLDIIITDHHECQEHLPDAFCIINPKRNDSTYPSNILAGVGITFKIIHAIAKRENIVDEIWKYLDIVSIGTVADIVPLVGENRVLTALGFKQMLKTEHLGLKALLDLVTVNNKKITSSLIGYQIGPRINAVGRLSNATIGVKLLTTEDEDEAKALATLLDEENKKRRDLELSIMQEAEQYIKTFIDLETEKLLVIVGENWHHGVIGIVASRISTKYYKPTIILSLEDDKYIGSSRSIEGFNIFEAINAQRKYLIKFGGHSMAAGLLLSKENMQNFKNSIIRDTEDVLTEDILLPTLNIDMEIALSKISLDLCDRIEKLEPFGKDNPTPIFKLTSTVYNITTIGQEKSHLKFSLKKEGNPISGVGFGKSYALNYLEEEEEIMIAGEIAKNEWKGMCSIQVRIKDIKSPLNSNIRSYYYQNLFEHLKCPELIDKVDFIDNHIFSEINIIKMYQEKYDTKDMKICYNKECDLGSVYVRDMCTNNIYTISKQDFLPQISKMVPNYDQCRNMYRILAVNKSKVLMHKLVNNVYTEYKILQILDILKELNLIEYNIKQDSITYVIHKSIKTKLESSNRYKYLQNFSRTINI